MGDVDIETVYRQLVSTIGSCPPDTSCTLTKIESEYKTINYKPIPYRELGFSSVEVLLRSRPDMFKISILNGIKVVSVADKPETEKLQDLVKKQTKDPKKLMQSRGLLSPVNERGDTMLPQSRHNEFMTLQGVQPNLPTLVREKLVDLANDMPPQCTVTLLTQMYRERYGMSLDWQRYGFKSQFHMAQYLCQMVFPARFTWTGSEMRRMEQPPPSVTSMEEKFQAILMDQLRTHTGFTLTQLINSSGLTIPNEMAKNIVIHLSDAHPAPLSITDLPSGDFLIGSGPSCASFASSTPRPFDAAHAIIRILIVTEKSGDVLFHTLDEAGLPSASNQTPPPLLSQFCRLWQCCMHRPDKYGQLRWLRYIIRKCTVANGKGMLLLQCMDAHCAEPEERVPLPSSDVRCLPAGCSPVMLSRATLHRYKRNEASSELWNVFRGKTLSCYRMPGFADPTILVLDEEDLTVLV